MALAEESTARPSTTGSTTRSGILVAVICGCAVMFDGYDLSVFGTTIPALLAYEPWGLDAAEAGVIASYALMGMLVGTLVCGVATDLLGRRRMLLTSVTVFSVFMVGCALAPSAELFGLFRFLAGVGLGGLLPTAIALTVLSFLATMSVGAIVGASALAWLADRVGPRRMALAGFVIGVLALVTLSLGPPTAVLYVAVFLAGVGANGTAVVLNGFIATWFPAGVRATALGSIMTVARLGGIFGPILGGLIAAAGVPVAWNFYAFLVPAAIGVLVVLLLPSRHLDGSPLGTH